MKAFSRPGGGKSGTRNSRVNQWLYVGSLLILVMVPPVSCGRSTTDFTELPALLNTNDNEYSLTLSAMGDELYFTRARGKWGQEVLQSTIYRSIRINGEWKTPEPAGLHPGYNTSDPHLTQDGTCLYFVSEKPVAKDSSQNIWCVNRESPVSVWGAPKMLDYLVNSENQEYSPKTTRNGDLYFASDRPGGMGQGDLYIAQKTTGSLGPPVSLGPVLNSEKGEWNLELNSDGDILIFEASQRRENISSYGDLYISFKKNGSWSLPQNISSANTSGSDLYPVFLSNDELLYSSSRRMDGLQTDFFIGDLKQILGKHEVVAKWPRDYLLIVNRSSHSVSLVEIATGRIHREYEVGLGPHEIGVSGDHNWAFIPNYGSYPVPHKDIIAAAELNWIDSVGTSVTRIDLRNGDTHCLRLEKSVMPHGIAVNKDGSSIWITDEQKGRVHQLNGMNGAYEMYFETRPGSHIIMPALDYTKLYVSNTDDSSVSVIDLCSGTISHLDTPDGPEGLALSPDGTELWILCNQANRIAVLDLSTNRITSEFSSEGVFPVKMTFTNDESWVNNVGSREIAIFDPESHQLISKIALDDTPLGIAYFNNQVFVTMPRRNEIVVIDAATKNEIRRMRVGMESDGMVILRLGL